ncbi:hypothetical protein ACFL5I_01860 [Planctomycetota bacterium]
MSIKEIIELVQSVGFPIVIALLFYIDLRKVVKCNTRALDGLAKQQKKLIELFNYSGIPYLAYKGRANANINKVPEKSRNIHEV